VNVFLGLGTPWVLAAIYWQIKVIFLTNSIINHDDLILLNFFHNLKGLPFSVKAGSLTFSVAVYTVVSFICLAILFCRRYMGVFGKGELGGPPVPKWFTSIFFVFLWGVYLVLSALQAYEILPF